MSRRVIAPTAAAIGALLVASAAVARHDAGSGRGSARSVSCSTSAKPKLPDGEPLRLSGIWKETESGGSAYVRQLGNCYWMLLMSPDGGRQFAGVAHGRIGPGPVIEGAWADTPRMTTVMGSGTFRQKLIVTGAGEITIGAGGITYGPLTLQKACQTPTRC